MYLLHLFGEESLDTLVMIPEITYLREFLSKGHHDNCSWYHKWKPTNFEEILAFLSIAVSMTLSKSSVKAF